MGEWSCKPVALKIFKPAGASAQEQERRWHLFRREARILQKLHHPRLVKLMGAFASSDGSPGLVMELLDGNTLHDLLHGRRTSLTPVLDPPHRFLLSVHLAQGISYLHGLLPPILHRDLKSRNVVVAREPAYFGPPCAAKIIDFGLAEHLVTTVSEKAHLLPTMESMGQLSTWLQNASRSQAVYPQRLMSGPWDVYSLKSSVVHRHIQSVRMLRW